MPYGRAKLGVLRERMRRVASMFRMWRAQYGTLRSSLVIADSWQMQHIACLGCWVVSMPVFRLGLGSGGGVANGCPVAESRRRATSTGCL